MKVAALVPVKGFARGKQRLRARFSAREVEAIERAMLEDVLGALLSSRVAATYVVTGDDTVAEAALQAGVAVRRLLPDPGLNAALDLVEREIADYGYDASLVVLGDLPLLGAAHIDLVVDAPGTHGVAIVPARDGGTALMLRRPPQCIPARFGPASAREHLLAAAARGVRVHVETRIDEAVRSDLDTPEDARRLLAEAPACRTQAVLRDLRW